MIFKKGDIIKDKEVLNQKKQDLMKLFDTLEIDLNNDKAFALIGRIKTYSDAGKVGIKDLMEEYNNTYQNLSDEEKQNKLKQIYRATKIRCDSHEYIFKEGMKRVDGNYAFGLGLLIPKGIIIVDADDEETSNVILNFIKENNIDTPMVKTNHGYHFYFKTDKEIKHRAGVQAVLGVTVDYRSHGNGKNYIVLPYRENYRTVAHNNGVVAELPKELYPVVEEKKSTKSKTKTNKTASTEPIQAFKEGSRNDSLYRYLCGFANNVQLRTYENLLSLGIGANTIKCNPPLEHEEVEAIVRNVIDNYTLPSYMSNNNKIIAYNLAETIVADYNCVSDTMNSYIYNGKYYEEVPVDYYKIIDKYISDKSLMKTTMIKEVTSQIYRQSNKGTIENSRDYINFKNGLYNIKTRKLEPHNKDIITLGVINGEYDPKKSDITGTTFERFLNTSLDAELIPVVQQMLGVCLYPLTDKIHYFYALVGEGRNGKGVLLDIILNMIPNNLRSGLPMGGYDERFSSSQIKGKQINICTDDKTTRLEGIGNLKSVTAGEGIFCEKKGVDGEMIKAVLTHISAFNVLPSLQEKSNALFDRMILIKFNRTFGTEEEVQRGEKDAVRDINLKTNIINNELDIVVNWALQGLLRVIDNGYKFTITDSIQSTMEDYREEVDSVRAWIKSEIKPVAGTKNSDYKKDKELYKLYKEYCEDEEILPVGRKAFKEGCRRHLRKYWKNIDRYDCYSVKKASITDFIEAKNSTVAPAPSIKKQLALEGMKEIPHDADCPF